MNIIGEKFSYSKLSTFKECGYKYKLVYVDKHRVSMDTIATLFGSLVHHIEEDMGNRIIDAGSVDALHDEYYDYLKDTFMTLDDKDKKLYGVNKLKEMFPNQWYEADKNGLTYQDKVDYYLSKGIYRLANYLRENPELEIKHTEMEFKMAYKEKILYGFIDRVYYNRKTDTYIVEDIKTYSKDIESKKLKVPLQMVVYTLAMKDKIENCKVACQYELPLIGSRQLVKNKSYLNMGEDEMDKLFEDIVAEDFIPHPTPLCHWCQFCPTNPDQPEEGKNLCPYYCKWTRENKTMAVLNRWQGKEKDILLVESLKKPQVKVTTTIRPITINPKRIVRRRG